MTRALALMLLFMAAPSGLAQNDESAALWRKIESVLTSPRCLNCHTATEFPRQGDDRHRHLHGVLRGRDGRGVPGQTCAACHPSTNQSMSGVPGGPSWHLAPRSMA